MLHSLTFSGTYFREIPKKQSAEMNNVCKVPTFPLRSAWEFWNAHKFKLYVTCILTRKVNCCCRWKEAPSISQPLVAFFHRHRERKNWNAETWRRVQRIPLPLAIVDEDLLSKKEREKNVKSSSMSNKSKKWSSLMNHGKNFQWNSFSRRKKRGRRLWQGRREENAIKKNSFRSHLFLISSQKNREIVKNYNCLSPHGMQAIFIKTSWKIFFASSFFIISCVYIERVHRFVKFLQVQQQ